jgi:hypothetical protein
MAKTGMKVGMKPQRARNKFLREAKEKRAFEAKVRQELADKRPVGEQIGRLDAGGYTATKERAKLMKKLSAAIAEQPRRSAVMTTEGVAESYEVVKAAKVKKAKKKG